MATTAAPTLADVQAARERLAGVARETPVYRSETFSRLTGREVWLKAENLQRTGSFKIRGAVNRLATLSEEERAAGVVAASAGNHGQAVAWAARELGVEATIFMPQDAPMAKVEACRSYGAAVELVGAGFDETLEEALDHAGRTRATFVHAFEDETVIAGQGTIGLELADQLAELGTIVVPVGGGGLAAGIAIALAGTEASIVGVQAAACAPLAGGESHGPTIADGIAVKKPGELTTAILRDRLERVVAVDDEQIGDALLLLLERTKLVVEGAGAAPAAALLAGLVPGEGPVCLILSGGNIDATTLLSVMRYGLSRAGRYLVVRTSVPDRPGELVKLLELVAGLRGNVVSIEHHREGARLHVTETEIGLTIATRDEAHCAELLDAMRAAGYAVERLR